MLFSDSTFQEHCLRSTNLAIRETGSRPGNLEKNRLSTGNHLPHRFSRALSKHRTLNAKPSIYSMATIGAPTGSYRIRFKLATLSRRFRPFQAALPIVEQHGNEKGSPQRLKSQSVALRHKGIFDARLPHGLDRREPHEKLQV